MRGRGQRDERGGELHAGSDNSKHSARNGGGGEEERPPYAPDGLHPNEWGYGMWAEQIVAKVRWDQ